MMQRPEHPVIQVEALLWELEQRGVDPDVIERYVRLAIVRTRDAEVRLALQRLAEQRLAHQRQVQSRVASENTGISLAPLAS